MYTLILANINVYILYGMFHAQKFVVCVHMHSFPVVLQEKNAYEHRHLLICKMQDCFNLAYFEPPLYKHCFPKFALPVVDGEFFSSPSGTIAFYYSCNHGMIVGFHQMLITTVQFTCGWLSTLISK